MQFRLLAILTVVVYCIDWSRVSYVRLVNQCSLYLDKTRIFEKFSGSGLYTGTGALNRSKFTVLAGSSPCFAESVRYLQV